MDLRKRKTLRAIEAAFYQIRRQKDLERITVTELAKAAEISKATFYLHYRDIFDLSAKLQDSVLQEVFSKLDDPMAILTDPTTFMRKLVSAAETELEKLTFLFSGSQTAALPLRIEAGIRESIFRKNPALRDDPEINVQLSYRVQGGYYAYMENVRIFGSPTVFAALEKVQGEMELHRTI